ncbi:DNA mismatch repair protein MutS2 [Lachnospiraceae bacterium PFB1-21]
MMNKKSLNKLEYDKIIGLLSEQASFKGGRDLCENLMPLSSLEEVEKAQDETACAFSRIVKKGRLSFYGLVPINGLLKRLEVGAILGSGELLHLKNMLKSAAQAKSYGRRERSDEPGDLLDTYFDLLSPLTPLATEIERCILAEDEISDEASPNLKNIRSQMKRINDRIHSTLNQMVNKSLRTYLQDPIVTMRGDRYCLPVKAEYKAQVPGMIHDQSATGSTLFIEPLAVVNLNNDMRELLAKEKDEIQVILADLSNQCSEFLPEMKVNNETLATLDFIFAKGNLAYLWKAAKPLYNDEGIIEIREGRHPLLDPKTVVPITVSLGDAFSLLVITGPNTGGKTVTLKTIGLFSLIGQAGLHIPALDRSRLSLFSDVLADIGDEQSIEQSLSTFSSHLTNIVSFLKTIDDRSLVLFDELGAGTDPTEGAALAIAILDYLHARGIRTAATTHYSELKVYALSTKGVENASCEFDVNTLRPTYRLLIGVPGKSNAFAIAKRLGLPDYIIDAAKEQIDEEDESFEDLIGDLDRRRKDIEAKKMEIDRHNLDLKKQKERLAEKEGKLDARRDKIIQAANEEAAKVLSDAKAEADDLIKKLRKYGENISLADLERDREKVRKRLAKTGAPAITPAPRTAGELKPTDLKLGEKVRVLSLNVTGNVIELPDKKGNVTVQMGIIKSRLPLSDLEIIDEEPLYVKKQKEQRRNIGSGMGKSLSIRPEINLIGKTVDEAIAALDKYLDDAYLAHLSSVRIIHGKGTGALRKAVADHLKKQKYVKSFRAGEFGEGDAGVTVAEFKE